MSLPKKRIILRAGLPFVVLAAAVTAVYLLFFAPKDYADLVPAESKLVAEIAPADFYRLDGTDGLAASLAGVSLDGADGECPAYLFVSPNEYYGMAVALKDATAFSAALGRRAAKKEVRLLPASDGLHWAWSEKGWMIAWNEHALLVMGPAAWQESDDLRQTLRQIFKAKASGSFRHSDRYEAFEALTPGSRLCASPDALPSPFGVLARLDIPYDTDPARVRLYATLQFGAKGTSVPTLTLQGTLRGTDPQAQEQLDTYDAAGRDLPADVMGQLPEGILFCMAATSQKANLLELLRSDATTKTLLLNLDKGIDRATLQAGDNCFALTVSALDKEQNATYGLDIVRNDSTIYHAQSAAWSAPAGQTTAAQAAGLRAYFRLDPQSLAAQPCFDEATASLIRTLSGGSHAVELRATKGHNVNLTIQ